jgi:hypothetical protein
VSGADLGALAAELCEVFLGWRLGEDEEALLALGEGALRIDLRSGECWCDGEPLPPLFIAGELQRRLAAAFGDGDSSVPEAHLEALFATRPSGAAGSRRPALQIACACVLADEAGLHRAEARRDA